MSKVQSQSSSFYFDIQLHCSLVSKFIRYFCLWTWDASALSMSDHARVACCTIMLCACVCVGVYYIHTPACSHSAVSNSVSICSTGGRAGGHQKTSKKTGDLPLKRQLCSWSLPGHLLLQMDDRYYPVNCLVLLQALALPTFRLHQCILFTLCVHIAF